MEQQNGQASAERVVAGLQRDFKIVGTHRVHSWYAWAIIGIVFGMALGVIYVANKTTSFVSSKAATVAQAANTYVVSKAPRKGGSGGTVEVSPIGTMTGTATEYRPLTAEKLSDSYAKASLSREFSDAASFARTSEFITIGGASQNQQLKADKIPAGGGFSFKVPVSVVGGAARITRAEVAFTTGESATVFVNGSPVGGSFERTKGSAGEVRRVSLPAGVLQDGVNFVEFRLIRPEKAARDFVLNFIIGINAPPLEARNANAATQEVASLVAPSTLSGWVKQEVSAGRLPRTGLFHAAKSGPRIIERYYITAGASPLSLEGVVFEKRPVTVKKAILGTSYTQQNAYGGSIPGLKLTLADENDGRLATMTIAEVSAALIDPTQNQKRLFEGSYTVANTEEKTLAFTLSSPVSIPALSTMVLEFYGDPRTALVDEDLKDPATRTSLVLQEAFRFTQVKTATGLIAVKNNIDRTSTALPGIPASLSVARDNLFTQTVRYSVRALSTPHYTRTASAAAALPVYELRATYGLFDAALTPKKFVFGYDVQAESGAPTLTDFVYQGIRGVVSEPGKIVFDMASGTRTSPAYDPYFNAIIAKATAGSTSKASARYSFRLLPDETIFSLRSDILGPDADIARVSYIIDPSTAGTKTLEGIKPVQVVNP